jgi:hypothetical protein
MFELQVLGTYEKNNIPNEVMDYLNQSAKKYFDYTDNEARKMCKTENELRILNDWLSGKNIYKDYDITGITKKEEYNAHSIILWVCGQGCG